MACAGSRGRGRQLLPWSCQYCSKMDLDRAMEWVQIARPELVAWSKTWGAIVMRAVMGKFEEEEGHGAMDTGEDGAIYGEDGVEGWKARMAVVCSRLPWKNQLGVMEDSEDEY